MLAVEQTERKCVFREMAKQIFMILVSGKIFNCLAGYYAILEHPEPQGGVAWDIIILLKDSYAICRDKVFHHRFRPINILMPEHTTFSAHSLEYSREHPHRVSHLTTHKVKKHSQMRTI